MNLSSHIQELLLAHDCVILPDFGAFVANYRPAYIDETRKLIYPPGKNLSFNRNLTHNDGLLIGQIAKSTGKGYNEVGKEVKAMLADWSESLRNGGRIEITDVGIIFGDTEGQPHFIPDQSANLIGAALGMEPLRITARKAQAAQPKAEKETVSHQHVRPSVKQPKLVEKKPEPTPQLRSVTNPQEKEKSSVEKKTPKVAEKKATGTDGHDVRPNRRPYYIAAACLLPIAFYSYWIPVHTDAIQTGEITISDFNPFSETVDHDTASKYKVRSAEFKPAINDEKVISFEDALAEMAENESIVTIPMTDDISIKVKVKPDGSIHEETDIDESSFDVAIDASGYYVIGGAYSIESNAHDKVRELTNQGYSPQIVDIHNGLHRVSYKRFDSRSAARELVDSIEASGGSAWVLKK